MQKEHKQNCVVVLQNSTLQEDKKHPAASSFFTSIPTIVQ